MLPNPDGSFSEVSAAGFTVRHAYGILTAESFAKYQASSESLLNDYLSSRSDGGTNGLTIVFDTDIYSPVVKGNSLLLLDEDKMASCGLAFEDYFKTNCPAYFGGIFIYSNATTAASFYIANVTTTNAPSEEEDDAIGIGGGATVHVTGLATSVGQWTVLSGGGDPQPTVVLVQFSDPPSGMTTNMLLTIAEPFGDLPVPPARPGYAFEGWFTEMDGAGDRILPDTLAPDVNMTLYSYWKPNTFTVKFAANGGAGTMAAQAIEYGASVALRANAFTKSGCLFLGWAKTASGAVAYANKAKVKNLAAIGKTVTLYAKWAVKKYAVKFHKNGGTLPKGKTMPAQAMAYGKAAALRANVFTRSGHVFIGWATSLANAGKYVVAYKNKQSVKNLRTDGKATVLYAVWAKKTYKVAFYSNGGKGKMAVEAFSYGKAKRLMACKFAAPKGYKFAGWATSVAKAKSGVVKFKNKQAVKNLTPKGGTVKLYAVWKKK